MNVVTPPLHSAAPPDSTPDASSSVPLNSSTTTTDTTTTLHSVAPPNWLSTNLRNIVVVALTLALLYLALVVREAIAITALITAWTWSAGGMFQEKAALKQPGKDV